LVQHVDPGTVEMAVQQLNVKKTRSEELVKKQEQRKCADRPKKFFGGVIRTELRRR